MRILLKHYLLDTLSLYIVSRVVEGVRFTEGLYTLFLTGLVLMLSTMVIRPILNLLLLPLNLITLGLFKWVTFAITFYIVTLLVPGFVVGSFVFRGFSDYWITIPPITLVGILGFLAFAFVISAFSTLLRWVFK